ncbi:hypothetical protein N7491_009381 [Penicillium cf. griseofulvum]|uniref:Uncharacterized protein n=1 Tax=Penicillium cf. griseofulvum TaxID=2972120 RepID=A0A9W9MFY3_9EURO|nr:hypothetical protein N7472_005026 [Penicillium cf. griseofulvum]KAJ5424165.1 hypothetical protein N7491_009381 [Penicillium cf. griseofulvum]KAJ5442595.1 hypothetical protein N7445_005602 [Penicillium cf. griseofulvum]
MCNPVRSGEQSRRQETSAVSRATGSNVSPVSALAEWKWNRSGPRDWAGASEGKAVSLMAGGEEKRRMDQGLEC